MGKFSEDIQNIEDRNVTEDPQIIVPLRDQIPRKLRSALDDQEVGRTISNLWQTGNAERQEWLDRQKVYLAQWDDWVANLPEGPFDGSSQLHLPTTFIHAKGVHARLMSALFDLEPPFVVKAKTEQETERLDLVDAIMKHLLMEWANHNEGVKEVVSDWVWDYVTAGTGILKARWDREFTSFVDVDEELDIEPTVDEEETSLPADLKITEFEVIRKIKNFEGPVLELVRPEDLLILGGKGNTNRSDGLIHRQFLNGSQLWALADQKVFDKKAVETVIQSGEDHKSSSIGGEIKQDRAINEGKSNVDSEADKKQYEILESYLQWDVNGDGINEEIIVWTHKDTDVVLRSTYLHRTNRNGRRPFFKADFHRKADQDYGIGIVEMMFSLSLEKDAMHNQAVDSGTIKNMPFGFYRPSSSLDPEIIEFTPGAMIPLDDPQRDVNFPRVNGGHEFNLQMDQVIDNNINRLTGLSDLNFGQLSSQGAARTATGARALIGEANINLNIPLGNLARAWRQCLRYLFSLLQQRIPDGYAFRVTGQRGEDYFVKIKSRHDIAGQFDFEISENSSNSNRQIQQSVAQQIHNVVMNPVNIQTGIVDQSGIFEANKNLLQSLEVKDWSKYLRKPEGSRRVLTPKEEADRILGGLSVKVQLGDDHEGFITLVAEMLKSDEVVSAYPAEVLGLLQAQSREHQNALQTVQQLQANQRANNQIQNNVAQSEQQAPLQEPTAVQGGTQGGGQEEQS